MIIPGGRTLLPRQPKKSLLISGHQEIVLMPVGDVHAGSQGWPKKHFKAHIQWGLDRGAWFLGMGDYVDFTSGSQRRVLSALRDSERRRITDWATTQLDVLKECMEPSRGRWLGLLEGNHWVEFEDGTTCDQKLCEFLGAPFLGSATLYNIALRRSNHNARCTVTIFAAHVEGTFARRAGGQLNRVEDMESVAEADIYLLAHSHSKVNDPKDRLYRTTGGHLYHRTKIFARTGGFLRGYDGTKPFSSGVPAARSRGSYVEQRIYRPTALGGPLITIGTRRIEQRGAVDIWVPSLHISV